MEQWPKYQTVFRWFRNQRARSELSLICDACWFFCRIFWGDKSPWGHMHSSDCTRMPKALGLFSCDALQGVSVARGDSRRYYQAQAGDLAFVFPLQTVGIIHKNRFCFSITTEFLRAPQVVASFILVFLSGIQQILKECSLEKAIAISKALTLKRLEL